MGSLRRSANSTSVTSASGWSAGTTTTQVSRAMLRLRTPVGGAANRAMARSVRLSTSSRTALVP